MPGAAADARPEDAPRVLQPRVAMVAIAAYVGARLISDAASLEIGLVLNLPVDSDTAH